MPGRHTRVAALAAVALLCLSAGCTLAPPPLRALTNGTPAADGPSTAVTWSGSAEQLVSVTGATVLFTARPSPGQDSWEPPAGIVVLRGTPGTEAVLAFRDARTGAVHQERYRLSG